MQGNSQAAQVQMINFDRSSLDKKQSIIKLLSQRNQKLHQQIKLIETAIAQKIQTKEEKAPKKRQSLIKIEQNVDLLNRQLSNCYKKIKLYEYQVSKYQKLQSQISPGERLIQVQLQIKQKKDISDKMKHQAANLQKQITENAKKLGGNHQLYQNQRNAKQLNDKINFLKEMVKQYQDKQRSKQNQLKKEYAHIKKVQNQFIQNGGSISQIEQLKQRVISILTINQKVPKNNSQSMPNQKMVSIQTNNEEQQIQDRSKLHFQNILNQISVLQKLNKKYEKQISQAQRSQAETIQKNSICKQKLVDLQEKITELQQKISEQKGSILPGNMKPQKALRSISTYQSAKIKNESKNGSSLNLKSANKSRSLNHVLKYETVGNISKQGVSFTDRNILGQVKLQTKIIGLVVFVDKQSQLINGIQAIYTKNKQGVEHLKKDRTSKYIPYKEEHYMCKDGDYIKNFGGTFNNEDKLQSISISTNFKQKHSFGLMKNSKKGFLFQTQQNQFPACIFGSMVIYKDTYRQYSSIEYLGVQIFNVNNNDSQLTSKNGSIADQ